MFKDLVKLIVKDVAVDLTQAFDRNFESKSFFNEKWKSGNYTNSRGSLLMLTGKLRRSISKPSVRTGTIRWSSNLPYASIQNEGGEIVVTAKMKSFFWAMYYKASKGVTKLKSGKTSNSQRNRKLTAEAGKWKAMALLKVGTVLKIEQRQFIGWHPQVDHRIKKTVNHNMNLVNKEIIKKLKQ